MYERFTDRARKVMQLANQEAQRFNHEYIGTEHVLLGLIKEGSGVAANVLKNLDVDLRKIRLEVEKLVQSGPDMVTMGKLPQTPRAKKVIEYSMEEARNLNHNYVGTEHILLGLLREQEGVAAQVLMNLGLKLEDVREEVLNLLGHGMDEGSDRSGMGGRQMAGGGSGGSDAPTKSGKSKTPALDSFGRDLTELAKQGKLDPVIGREHEIERAIQILCRRTKNNPVLIGEAGVGKTAIVEGFAQRVIEGNIPELLAERRIVVLDLAMMVAGTKHRGQVEARKLMDALVDVLAHLGEADQLADLLRLKVVEALPLEVLLLDLLDDVLRDAVELAQRRLREPHALVDHLAHVEHALGERRQLGIEKGELRLQGDDFAASGTDRAAIRSMMGLD